MHGLNIKRGRSKAHKDECKGIRNPDKPLSALNAKIGMEKLYIQRDKIYDEEMIYAADCQRCFRRFNIEGKKYVNIKKGAKQADQ